MFPDFRRYTTPSRGFTFLCCVDGIQQFLEFMFFFKACNVYGSANRTMPGDASAKEVSTTSVYAFSWNNCEFARFTPTLGSALMFLPEKGLFGGLFHKQRLVIKPDVIRTQGPSGVELFRTVISETPVKQITFNIKSVLEICWWCYLPSEICSKNARKNTRFVKNGDRIEVLGNDDVSPLSSLTMKWLGMTLNRKCPKGPLGLILWHLLHLYTSTVVSFVCSVKFCEATVLKLLTNAIYIS